MNIGVSFRIQFYGIGSSGRYSYSGFFAFSDSLELQHFGEYSKARVWRLRGFGFLEKLFFRKKILKSQRRGRIIYQGEGVRKVLAHTAFI